MKFPEFKLAVETVRLAQDESVWLRLSQSDQTNALWLILDAEGRPRGRLEVPANIRIRWSSGDFFWATVPDEYDVPWVVRYRISVH